MYVCIYVEVCVGTYVGKSVANGLEREGQLEALESEQAGLLLALGRNREDVEKCESVAVPDEVGQSPSQRRPRHLRLFHHHHYLPLFHIHTTKTTTKRVLGFFFFFQNSFRFN